MQMLHRIRYTEEKIVLILMPHTVAVTDALVLPRMAEIEARLANPHLCASLNILPAIEVGIPVRFPEGRPEYPLRDAFFVICTCTTQQM